MNFLAELIREGGTVVLTGDLIECDRITAMEIFEAIGLRVSGSVSRKTAALIVGDDARQEKIDRATQFGVPVYTESELWTAIYEVYPKYETR